MSKDKAQVADEIKAHLKALAQEWREGDTTAIDIMATSIESAIPANAINGDAIRARECAQFARTFGMSDKGVRYIVAAQCAYKDYMLWEDSVEGEKYRAAQQKKARKSRGKITDDGKSIGDIIARLALEKDELGDYVPAPSLWEPFFAALQDAGTSPSGKRDNSKPRKSFYSYSTDTGKTATISRGRFETRIGKYRDKKLSR